METINFNIKNQIGFLELNRPTKKNALNKLMIKEIIQTLSEQEKNKDLRVLILSGQDGIFCSGADLEWMKQGKQQSKQENKEDAGLWVEMFQRLNNFPRPVICEVEKAAMGGAIGLLCCADIVLASTNSKFAFPEVRLGLIPATIAPYVISKMGNSNGRKRMLYPDIFTVDEAQSEGLVHFIEEKNSLRQKTLDIAKSIANSAPEAMSQSKKLILSLHPELNNTTLHQYYMELIAEARASEEGQEGVSAFFEKRKPKWQNVKHKTEL